jgi:hypothetical protein
MVEEAAITVEYGLHELDRAWRRLQAVIDGADPDALVQETDPAGWSSKDHLAHLDAWANSVLVMIRDGRPQWEGLGIDKWLFDEEGYDSKNEVIRQRTVGTSLADVRASLVSTHGEILRVLSGMTDEQINQPCDAFVPGAGDFPIAYKIAGNTFGHYEEHRKYIERILQM